MTTAKKLANLADFVRSYNFQEGTVLTFTERYGQYIGQRLSAHFKRRIWQGSALAATTTLLFGLAMHYGSQRTQALTALPLIFSTGVVTYYTARFFELKARVPGIKAFMISHFLENPWMYDEKGQFTPPAIDAFRAAAGLTPTAVDTVVAEALADIEGSPQESSSGPAAGLEANSELRDLLRASKEPLPAFNWESFQRELKRNSPGDDSSPP